MVGAMCNVSEINSVGVFDSCEIDTSSQVFSSSVDHHLVSSLTGTCCP